MKSKTTYLVLFTRSLQAELDACPILAAQIERFSADSKSGEQAILNQFLRELDLCDPDHGMTVTFMGFHESHDDYQIVGQVDFAGSQGKLVDKIQGYYDDGGLAGDFRIGTHTARAEVALSA